MTAGFDPGALHTRRRAKGLTHAALGRALGVTRQAVSQWERGETVPATDTLPALADTLGCTIDDLFTRGDATTGACA